MVNGITLTQIDVPLSHLLILHSIEYVFFLIFEGNENEEKNIAVVIPESIVGKKPKKNQFIIPNTLGII